MTREILKQILERQDVKRTELAEDDVQYWDFVNTGSVQTVTLITI
jgi:hypothetical protein